MNDRVVGIGGFELDLEPRVRRSTLFKLLNAVFLSVYQRLRERADPVGIDLSWQYHFNEIGHAFVAEQLAGVIRN